MMWLVLMYFLYITRKAYASTARSDAKQAGNSVPPIGDRNTGTERETVNVVTTKGAGGEGAAVRSAGRDRGGDSGASA
ncbi:hypothetical protein FHU29_000182 [Hoyosella altamirensis]|uniref:Secreted protein n=1 Tax=Hoyosella altamirensis TaxID=616997 RepID=A0A839RHN5_9ACTN|nr:hypothetical protein [Hoyosella altamirensis]